MKLIDFVQQTWTKFVEWNVSRAREQAATEMILLVSPPANGKAAATIREGVGISEQRGISSEAPSVTRPRLSTRIAAGD
jgi:hypothetical protein